MVIVLATGHNARGFKPGEEILRAIETRSTTSFGGK